MTGRNVGWNLLGFGLPLFVAVACIPPLVEALGTARFGLLTLIWAVVSYFGVFDLGLGRALTQQVSAALGAGRNGAVPGITCTGLAAMLLLGVAAGVLMWALAPAGVALSTGLPDPSEADAAARAIERPAGFGGDEFERVEAEENAAAKRVHAADDGRVSEAQANETFRLGKDLGAR